MKYVKVLGLAAVVAAALMAFAGSASATILTSPEGTQLGVGTEITSKLTAGTKAVLKNNAIGEVVCEESNVAGKVTNAGSATETVSGNIETLTFEKCNGTVTVLRKGTLEVHSIAGTHNGTLTSTGAEVTVEILGFHCIFSTNNTDIGVVTGGSPATFKAESAEIPRTGGRSGILCGTAAFWFANYTITAPNPLLVD